MTVEHVPLALLDDRQRYGDELKREFDSATGEVSRLNVGQVYTALDPLIPTYRRPLDPRRGPV